MAQVSLLSDRNNIHFMSLRPTQTITSKNFSDTVEYAMHLKTLLDSYFNDKKSDVYPELFADTRVGGDPEFFIEDANNNIIPSYQFLGTPPESHDNFSICTGNHITTINPVIFSEDKSPYVKFTSENLKDYTSYWWLHPDGVQLEFGYFPAHCMEITSNYISGMLINTAKQLNAKNLRISRRTSAAIDMGQAMEVPLGCRPSYNAHNIDNNINDKNPLKRFTGGHFHFTMLAHPKQARFYYSDSFTVNTYDPNDIEVFESIYSLQNINDTVRQEHINKLVRVMDATLGIISVALAGEYDDPARRQHHYGMAGDYRLTSKTLEYRVPSNNMWMHPVAWHIIGMMGRFLVDQFKRPNSHEFSNSFHTFHDEISDWGEVIDIINNTDYQAARKWLEAKRVSIEALFDSEPKISNYYDKIRKLTKDGMFTYLEPFNWNNVSTSAYYPYPTSLKMLNI